MPLPASVVNTLGKVKSLGTPIAEGSPMGFGHLAGAAMMGYVAKQDYAARMKEGQNPLAASLLSGANAIAGITMGFVPSMLLMQAPLLVKSASEAYYAHYRGHTAWRRNATMPFSQSFQHTDITLQLQQRGLDSINRARGSAGAEAGLFAQMYGRR